MQYYSPYETETRKQSLNQLSWNTIHAVNEHPPWDGKILQKISGQGKVDRLSILVSGDGMEKLLGVPKLAAGTGEQEAEAVYSLSLIHI